MLVKTFSFKGESLYSKIVSRRSVTSSGLQIYLKIVRYSIKMLIATQEHRVWVCICDWGDVVYGFIYSSPISHAKLLYLCTHSLLPSSSGTVPSQEQEGWRGGRPALWWRCQFLSWPCFKSQESHLLLKTCLCPSRQMWQFMQECFL